MMIHGKLITAAALVLAHINCGNLVGPCPAHSFDLCVNLDKTVLETQDVGHAHHPDTVAVEAWAVVTVNRHPQSLHLVAELQWFDRHGSTGSWLTVDSESYGLHNLPPADGKPHRVNPRLEDTDCVPGLWRVMVHYVGKSSTGDRQEAGPDYFPSKHGKRLRCRPPR